MNNPINLKSATHVMLIFHFVILRYLEMNSLFQVHSPQLHEDVMPVTAVLHHMGPFFFFCTIALQVQALFHLLSPIAPAVFQYCFLPNFSLLLNVWFGLIFPRWICSFCMLNLILFSAHVSNFFSVPLYYFSVLTGVGKTLVSSVSFMLLSSSSKSLMCFLNITRLHSDSCGVQ